MVSKKLLLILFLVIAGALLVLFVNYKSSTVPAEKMTQTVAKPSLNECQKNFDITKLDLSDGAIWANDELAYMLRNFKIMESFSSEGKIGCLDFQNMEVATSLFSVDFCQENQKNIQMLYDFAGKIKQKIAEGDFVTGCQDTLLKGIKGLKEDVPENLWNERSNLFCKDMYLSSQRSVVVLDDAFVDDPTSKIKSICDCFDENGNKRTCQTEFCGIMKFFIAVSKNDQSLCPEISEFNIGPFCNYYFDKQYTEKYKNVFRDRYCQK